MPHTVAHPAAVLPLFGLRRLPASALVIGSVAPDLAYHVPFEVTRAQSHALAGVLCFALPAGLFAYLAFHAWVAPLLAECAPPALAARLPRRWRRGVPPRAAGAWVALAILLGALTHVTWDAFTHAGDPGVRAFPWLAEPLLHVRGFALRPYKLLQHGGSLLGVTAQALALRSWWRRTSVRLACSGDVDLSAATLGTIERVGLLSLVLLPSTAIVVRAGWSAFADRQGGWGALDRVFTAASFEATSVFLGMVLLVAGGRRWRRARRTHR